MKHNDRQKQYWIGRLSGDVADVNLYSTYPAASASGRVVNSIVLDEVVSTALNNLSKNNDLSLYVILLAAYKILLYRLTGQAAAVVGAPVINADDAIKDNWVFLRDELSDEESFKDLIIKVKKTVTEAFENQNLPYTELIAQSELKDRELFNALFVFENIHNTDAAKDIGAISKLMATFKKAGDIISMELSADAAHLSEAAVQRYTGYLLRIVGALTENIDGRYSEILLINKKEEETLVNEFNQTDAEYDRDATLMSLFEAQVAKTPDNKALILGDASMTYAELNDKANRLARILRDKGVGEGSIVSVLLERSFEMIIALYGILKAGGAYLPLDTSYPDDRISYILDDSGSSLLLSTNALFADRSVDCETIDLSSTNLDAPKGFNFAEGSFFAAEGSFSAAEGSFSAAEGSFSAAEGSNLISLNNSKKLAYVIYTSGSTGKPKGVMVAHQSVVNLVTFMQKNYPVAANDVYLLKTTYCFDVSVAELFGWFHDGGSLAILPPGDEKNPENLVNAIKKHSVTHINFVPSLFDYVVRILDNGEKVRALDSLTFIIVAGEAISVNLVNKVNLLLPHVRFENLYGPTEATIYASYYPLTNYNADRLVPIGKPVDNTTLLILNSNGSLSPMGVPGELCIAGEGLALGYINNPELTAKTFRDVTGTDWADARGISRVYHTGDLARILEDGTIEYLGRIDNQVKIRGFRIETGEIEKVAEEMAGIKQAVVMARTDRNGEKYLAAYYASKEALDHETIKAYLAAKLPAYMIPAVFVHLSAMPLNSNGKTDRKALPDPAELMTEKAHVEPQTESEKRLAALWQDITGVKKVSMTDDFFDIGGHSLNATILIAKVKNELGYDVDLQWFFDNPTLDAMAALIGEGVEGESELIAKAPVRDYYPLSKAQKRLYILDSIDEHSIGCNIPFVFRLAGKLDDAKLEAGIKTLIERHEGLRTAIITIDNEPYQKILDNVDFSLGVVDAQGKPEEAVNSIIKAFIRPFDLADAPLFRAGLIKTADDTALLTIDMHHIIADGFSINILLDELKALYNDESLKAKGIEYKDFAVWQHEAHENLDAQKNYWLDRFADDVPALDLATDFPRPKERSFAGAVDVFTIPQDLVDRLRRFSKEEGVTLFMTLYTAYYLLLNYYTGKEDIVVGTPIAGRNRAELADIFGAFINTLVLRTKSRGAMSIKELVKVVKEDAIAAFNNQDYPFEELIDALDIPRDTSRNPLFDTMFSYQTIEIDNQLADGLELTFYDYDYSVTKYDLALSAFESKSGLEFNFEYATSLFAPETITRMKKHYIKILDVVADAPETLLARIDIMEDAEKILTAESFNDTSAGYQADMTIDKLFAKQVTLTPDRSAVVFNNEKISYAELNERSNRIAHMLIEKGVKADSVVGILMERSIELIVGIVGIIKAGGAYLPLDIDAPDQRLLTMLNDAKVEILLTSGRAIDNHSFAYLKNLHNPRLAIVKTGVRDNFSDLDELPLLNRSQINCEKYLSGIGIQMVKNAMPLLTSRGCPYKCAYCQNIWKRHFKHRSAEHVFEEVKLYYGMGITRFAIIDDVFNLNRKNSERFFNLIIEHGLKVEIFFPNGLRGDILTPDFIDLMVKAGVVQFALALETASPRLQTLIGKNLKIEKLRENITYITENHPQVILDLFTMHGFPTESEEEALQTLAFIKESKWLHFPYVNILRIFPNTEMETLAIEHGISKDAIARSESYGDHEIFPDTLPFEKSFTVKYQQEFFNEYFLNKERLLHVLPYQMERLTEEEILLKYNSYLPVKVESFGDLLAFLGIERGELRIKTCRDEQVIDYALIKKELAETFKQEPPKDDALKLLLIDLSLAFSDEEHHLDIMVDQPLGLMSLASYLDAKMPGEVDMKIIQARIDFDNYAELEAIIKDYQPEMIGIRTLTFYKDFFHQAAALIRGWAKNAVIVTGGPYATSAYEYIVQDRNIDIAVVGEGEETMRQLVSAVIANNKNLPGYDALVAIDGVAFIPVEESIQSKWYAREIVSVDRASSILHDYAAGNPDVTISPENLCYIIFTSGSTGIPKGVMVEHRGVVNLSHWFNEKHNLTVNRNVLQMTNICFDVSVEETIVSLLNGATIFIPDKATRLDKTLLTAFINKNKINIAEIVPTLLKDFIIDNDKMESLNVIVTGAEKLNPAIKDLVLDKGYTLYNIYGPTETTVNSASVKCVKELDVIGKPMANTQIYIVDKYNRLLPVGVPGELCVAGDCLARGYLNDPALTSRKFPENPFEPGTRMYRTGDLARWLPDGNLEFLGRIDQQVKIRGYRVELGEIEAKLIGHADIKEACVLLDGNKANPTLTAYISSSENLNEESLVHYLTSKLPEYMVPARFVILPVLPQNRSGKVDRKALAKIKPAPQAAEAVQVTDMAIASNDIEKELIGIWKELLGTDIAGVSANFYDMGGNSLHIIKLGGIIKDHFGKDVPVVKLFQYSTIKSLAAYLADEAGLSVSAGADEDSHKVENGSGKIAVIGLAGRFPGAKNVDEFYANLRAGVESISEFSADELVAAGIDPAVVNGSNYVKAKGYLEDSEWFDNSFFGYSNADARVMDPQLRVFHEVCHEALEAAGYAPVEYEGKIGLFAGGSSSFFWKNMVLQNSTTPSHFYAADILSDKDFLATRVSYKLNLTGPSYAVQTACSTSLVAVDIACRSLLAGDCNIALAGGVSIGFPSKSGYYYEEGMIASPDGHCRPFGRGANGTVIGEGAGVVVLKRYEDAVKDGDVIDAVILGSAVNNDGTDKIGFTAPGVTGQADVIKKAINRAGIASDTIGYVETHGTGTKLGDPIEIEGLKMAFGTDKKGICKIGSVKSNIGHLDTAAGIASFIKTVLSVKHGEIFPSLYADETNPNINFNESPFVVSTETSEWQAASSPRRAGVSSFGIGGTNAHVIIEALQDNDAAYADSPETDQAYEIITLSARSAEALGVARENLKDFLLVNGDVRLADVAHTLQLGRRGFTHRLAVVGQNKAELIAALAGDDSENLIVGESSASYVVPQAEIDTLINSTASESGIRTYLEIAKHWVLGAAINWKKLTAGSQRRRCHLPTYPFERKQFTPAAAPVLTGVDKMQQKLASKQERRGLDIDMYNEEFFIKYTLEILEQKHNIKKADRAYVAALKWLDQLCMLYALDYLGSKIEVKKGARYDVSALKEQFRVLPLFQKLFDFIIKMLVDDEIVTHEEGTIEFLKNRWDLSDSHKVYEMAYLNHPEYRGLLRQLKYCVENYDKALTGDVPAISILYPEGEYDLSSELNVKIDDIYENLYVNLLKETILRVIDKNKRDEPIRILEVGAGRGINLRALGESLKGRDVEYHFTDLGKSFILKAKDYAKENGLDFVKFDIFDITQNPESQGFISNSYDIVIGMNVVHATKFINESLCGLRQVLRKDGLLFLIELTNSPRWSNLTWGLADGWWYFEDYHLRQYSPLVSHDTWQTEVARAGFQDVIVHPFEEEKRKKDWSLVIARQADDVEYVEVAAADKDSQSGEASMLDVDLGDETANRVARIWMECLGVTELSRESDFFELGGESLLGIQIISRINALFGIELSTNALAEEPVFDNFCKMVMGALSGSACSFSTGSSLLITLKKGAKDGHKLFLVHPVGGTVYFYKDLAGYIEGDVTVYGIQSPGLDGKESMLASIEDMAERYVAEIKKVQPEGPYLIGGSSFGGIAAYEMACILQERGDEVEMLALIDAPGPGKLPVKLEDKAEILTFYLASEEGQDLYDFNQVVEMLRSKSEDEQYQYFLEQMNEGKKAFSAETVEQLKRSIEMYKNNSDTMYPYQPRPYKGDMVFFRALVKSPTLPDRLERPWYDLVEGEISLHHVPGNHLTMNFFPNAGEMARLINKRLQKAVGAVPIQQS